MTKRTDVRGLADAAGFETEAESALDEAVRLFLRTAEDQGTLTDVLEESGHVPDGPQWRSPAWVGLEHASATVGA